MAVNAAKQPPLEPTSAGAPAIVLPVPSGGKTQVSWLGVAMFAPAVLYLTAIIGVPLVLAFLYAFGNVRVGSSGYEWVGLANFRHIIENPTFRRSLLNSCLFTVATQVLVMVGATILSFALWQPFRGRSLVRFLILLPWVAPISLGAIGWKWILDSLYSVVNWVLIHLHLANPFTPPMWLGEPSLAAMSVIMVNVWRLLPFATVILLAGLSAIPREIPEAAAVDGAGFWRTLFLITVPMLRPIMNVAILFGVIFTFTDMTVVYILTRGGPYDTTQVLPSLAFFSGVLGGDLAAGAATSLFLVPVLLIVAVLMLRTAYRAEVS
jgi:multiple sugar transport system permease protein